MREIRMNKSAVFILALLFLTRAATLEAASIDPVSVDDYGSLLSLNEALSRTLESDARVKEAAERLEKEKSLYKSKRAEFFPKVSTDLFQAVATGAKKNLTYFDTSITQTLFQGGKLRAEKARQETRVKQEELRLEEVKLDLKLNTEVLYAQALQEKELTRLTQYQVKELGKYYQVVKALREKELVTNYDLLHVETLFAKSKQGLVKHKESYDYLIGFLKILLGINDSEALELEPLKDVPGLEEDLHAYFDSAKQDPIYRIKELQVAEKGFEKRSLQADRYPHFGIVAKTDVSRDVSMDTNRFVLGVAAKWDIWDFGRLGNQIHAKDHEIEETKWAGKAEIQEKERKIRKLFHTARALKEKIRLSETLISEREEGYKNEKVRIIAGDKGTEEALDSFLALQQAYGAQVSAMTEYRIAVSTLKRQAALEVKDDPKELVSHHD